MASSSSSSSSSSRKRKCGVLTLEQKLAILDCLKKGESQEILSSEYGSRSYASTMESLSMSSKTRKVMHLADDEKLDEAVYLSTHIQQFQLSDSASVPLVTDK